MLIGPDWAWTEGAATVAAAVAPAAIRNLRRVAVLELLISRPLSLGVFKRFGRLPRQLTNLRQRLLFQRQNISRRH
jgi:hypothetical protein